MLVVMREISMADGPVAGARYAATSAFQANSMSGLSIVHGLFVHYLHPIILYIDV